MIDATYYCYRLTVYEPYDEEDVWAFVQRHGGYMSIRNDVIDFWIPRQYLSLMLLAYPELVRQHNLDYI